MENPDIAPNAARCRFRRIVVKVGSNVLTRADGTLDTDRMAALADQIAALHRAGVEVIVVSSGAVAAGRGVIAAGHRLDAVSARQLYSAVGQVKLIRRYYELFDARGIVCGQVLTTKQDFETRRHYLNQRNSIRVMLENGVVPIVNENDTVAVTELMFTDNDELSGLLSTMIGAEALVLLTNVDGICDGMPGAPGVEVIREIAPGQRDLPDCIRDAKSSFGRGGMLTKSRIARKVAAEGIETIIADGRRDGILPDLLAEGSRTLCTRFLPSPHPISGVKKWIAHSEGFAKGEVHVTREALDALGGPRAVSLLPVGVSRVEGVFEKDTSCASSPPTAGRSAPARSPATARRHAAISAAAAHGHSYTTITSIWTDPWRRNTLFDAPARPPARSTAPPRNGSTACCWRWPTRWRPARRSCWRPMPATAAG